MLPRASLTVKPICETSLAATSSPSNSPPLRPTAPVRLSRSSAFLHTFPQETCPGFGVKGLHRLYAAHRQRFSLPRAIHRNFGPIRDDEPFRSRLPRRALGTHWRLSELRSLPQIQPWRAKERLVSDILPWSRSLAWQPQYRNPELLPSGSSGSFFPPPRRPTPTLRASLTEEILAESRRFRGGRWICPLGKTRSPAPDRTTRHSVPLLTSY